MTTAFVLSGGGNLGPMQAGTIVALTEAGVIPDLLVGTSVGALNAAFLSTRPGVGGARALMAAWSALHRRQAVRLNPLTALAGFLGTRDHLVSDQQLRQLIRRWVEIGRIEQATTPFAVVATDALTGEDVVLTCGDVVDALAASSAVPGLFPPVQIDGRWLVDGGLSANHPVLQAQTLGADDIYVITTATAPRPPRPPRGAVAVAMTSAALVMMRADRRRLEEAADRAAAAGGSIRIVPSAEPSAPGPFDFRRSDSLATAAYRRTKLWLATDVPLS
ncbi:MAG: patatin-like phospholipase family protein [Acidimicrobiales bacterium]|jgi:NTE family protein